MKDFTDIEYVRALQSNLRTTFESPQGKETMKFMQEIGSWYPTMLDAMDTNSIISRDATRRLLGTIRTLLELTPEQVVALAKSGGDYARYIE